MQNKSTYVFDIDGTICSLTNGKYEMAHPIAERIEVVNKLFDLGNVIILLTARGMGTFNNDQDLAREKWETFTIEQLSQWKVNYHKVFFGKPAADYYIDDKGISDADFFSGKIPHPD